MEDEIRPDTFGVTPSLFLEWRSPRFGKKNPTKLKSKVWEWLVHSKLSGYESTQKMSGPSPFDEGPTWSFDRFGQSTTKLADGRTIYIGGEHEDSYDPDFYIYNDVVVAHPDGSIDFYCYPKSDFPPTDFHSAVLLDGKIIIIGRLGYLDDRPKTDTQIYELDLDTYAINKIDASGLSPGWIYSHIAALQNNKKDIVVTGGKLDCGQDESPKENIDDWALSVSNWHWRRLTNRNWARWELKRLDKQDNHLWDIRQALWNLEANWMDDYQSDMGHLENTLGCKPDVKLINDLYKFEFDHSELQEDEEEHNVFWVFIDDVRVRFVEESYALQTTIEGAISDQKIILIKEHLIDVFSKLENTEITIESI